MEDDGYSGTRGSVWGGSQSRRKIVDGVVPGVRHLPAHRDVVEATLPTRRTGGDRGTESQAASQSVAHGGGVGAAGSRGTAGLSRLGGAQGASVAGARGRAVDAQHRSPDFIAA